VKDGRRAVTIAEVASDAGVSVPTVSRVLNGSAPVAAQTKHRVLRSIERLGYHPNPMAQSLSRGQSNVVMVIVPHIAEPSVTSRLQGLIGVLRDSPYELHLVDIEQPAAERDRSLAEIVAQHRPAAAVIFSLPPSEGDERWFRDRGTPVVLVDVESAVLPSDSIDDVAGGAMAVRHLLGLGHRRIAFVGDDEASTVGVPASARRRIGYETALADAGIPARPDYVRTASGAPDAACLLALDLFALAEPPTAVFAAYDVQAFGVLSAARQVGLDVPGQLSVVGFDDILAASLAGLTTVRQPLEVSGRRAGLRVLEALGHTSQEALPSLPALELVSRGTTGPVDATGNYVRSPTEASSEVNVGGKEVSTTLDFAARRSEGIPRRK
jgi:DNA-binding LacI/PurR family transcriptional regulator